MDGEGNALAAIQEDQSTPSAKRKKESGYMRFLKNLPVLLRQMEYHWNMRRPSKVAIASIEWTIKYTQRGLADKLGKCDHSTQTIYIKSTLPRTTLRHVLLHEILHAMWYSYGLNPDLRPDEVEESIINSLSGPLIDVMNQNPTVVKFLFEDGIWA